MTKTKPVPQQNNTNDWREIAKTFHDTYEDLAPQFGYITKPETREFDVESNNGKLMIEVCKRIITQQQENVRREIREYQYGFIRDDGSGEPERAPEWQVIEDLLTHLQSPKVEDKNIKI